MPCDKFQLEDEIQRNDMYIGISVKLRVNYVDRGSTDPAAPAGIQIGSINLLYHRISKVKILAT